MLTVPTHHPSTIQKLKRIFRGDADDLRSYLDGAVEGRLDVEGITFLASAPPFMRKLPNRCCDNAQFIDLVEYLNPIYIHNYYSFRSAQL